MKEEKGNIQQFHFDRFTQLTRDVIVELGASRIEVTFSATY